MPRGARSRAEVRELVAKADFELLETIAVLNGGLDEPARLAEIAKEYGVTKQAIGVKVKRLRRRGWLEGGDERRSWGVRLTHNGKLLVETGLGAGLTE